MNKNRSNFEIKACNKMNEIILNDVFECESDFFFSLLVFSKDFIFLKNSQIVRFFYNYVTIKYRICTCFLLVFSSQCFWNIWQTSMQIKFSNSIKSFKAFGIMSFYSISKKFYHWLYVCRAGHNTYLNKIEKINL